MPDKISPAEAIMRATEALKGFNVEITGLNDDELRTVVNLIMVILSNRERMQGNR